MSTLTLIQMAQKNFNSSASQLLIPVTLIERRIYIIRGQKVMLDADLADLYQVETRMLVQTVKRNFERFPTDFIFQLSAKEGASLRACLESNG